MASKELSKVKAMITRMGNAGERIYPRGPTWEALPFAIRRQCEKKAALWGISNTSALYCVLYNNGKLRVCATCGKTLNFLGFRTAQINHCNPKCAGADPEVELRRQKTCKRVYGVPHVQKVSRVRKQFRATMRQRHGVDYTGASPKLLAKCRNTTRARLGVDHSFQSPEVRAKTRATWLRNYGVSHPMQNRQVFEAAGQSGYQRKTCRIQGKIFTVQGYEPQALSYLVKLGYSAKRIVNKAKEGMPSIPYRDGQRQRVYHPDFLIDGRILVEVKSDYTLGLYQSKQSRNLWLTTRRKLKASAAAGYRVLLVVVFADGKCAAIKSPHLKTKRELLTLIHEQLDVFTFD